MIVTERLPDGRTHSYSDNGKWIRQVDTGAEYEEAVDSVAHVYEETDKDIVTEATAEEVLNIILGGDTL